MCATETALLEVILVVFAVVPLPKVTESRFWQELLQRSSCSFVMGNNEQVLMNRDCGKMNSASICAEHQQTPQLCWQKGSHTCPLMGLCPHNPSTFSEVSEHLGDPCCWLAGQANPGDPDSHLSHQVVDGCPPAG